MASRKATKRKAVKPKGSRAKPKAVARPGARPAGRRPVPRARREAASPAAKGSPAVAPAAALPAVAQAPLREQFMDRMRQTLLAKRKELVDGVRGSSMDSMEASAETIQDIADQASTAYTKEFLLSIGDTERRLLQQVDHALDKIRRKSYGLCEKCGEPVGEKRLEALPFAKLCIRCAEEEEGR